jgi:hypothetical protein
MPQVGAIILKGSAHYATSLIGFDRLMRMVEIRNYFPFHTGSRFSAKALNPSMLSSEA